MTLKKIIDMFLRNSRQFITVIRECGDHYCFPTNHAWSKPQLPDNSPITRYFDKMMENGTMHNNVRALSFVDENFDIEKQYGEFSNWYVYTIYADTFVNPFINELDETLAIVITQNISEEENKDVDVL